MADNYLPTWMGEIAPVLANSTLLDLSLPGTHDSMTYDLSAIVSDGGIDDYPDLSAVLNVISSWDLIPSNVDAFMQSQAQTQGLNITEQLNAGMRFVDFRVMYSKASGDADWYCLHMMQSNEPALVYLNEIRAWVDDHPTEVVVLWISKHGSECATGEDAYPGVGNTTKQAFWADIRDTFDGLLIDTAISPLNITTYPELLKRSHRVAIFASDFVEFTGGATTLASDGCDVDNRLDFSDVDSLSLDADLAVFQGTADLRTSDRAADKFLLYSMANSPPGDGIMDAAKVVLEAGGTSEIASCAAQYSIPNMTDWCPAALLDVGQLTNYYKQTSIELAYEAGYAFPNAFYIDAVDAGGLLRTGTRTLTTDESALICDIFTWSSCESSADDASCDAGYTLNQDTTAHWDCYDSDGTEHGFCGWAWQDHYQCCREADADHDDNGYAYVDTVVAYNIRQACAQTSFDECDALMEEAEARRSANPASVWSDLATGRHDDWPEVTAHIE